MVGIFLSKGKLRENSSALLRGTTVWLDDRPIVGNVPSRVLEEQIFEPTIGDRSMVEATSWQRGDRGEIELVATTPHPFSLRNSTDCR